ncbi:MAG: GNAT family N-acetyltransferase, partial [Sedimenticola sp.]|nr:GNAT family N-acetyltransferase [Sedimenticola sp.]
MDNRKRKPERQLEIESMASLKSWGDPPSALAPELAQETVIDCGWGRLIFGQTFGSNSRLAQELKDERPGRRDVALYTRDPHVVVSKDPQALFIDPSLTYRLDLTTAELDLRLPEGVVIRSVTGGWDEYHINRIYKARGMVELKSGFSEHLLSEPSLKTLVAVDQQSGDVIGCVTGVDHYQAFEDPDNGCSLWALAVDPQCLHPGIGRALVTRLAEDFKQSGRAFMDLSVMHDNAEAIQLYHTLGFFQVPVYCVKTKNVINEHLYVGPRSEESLNVYAQIIVDEACRRGIAVDIVDASGGFFDLSLGGRTVSCRESLTELTSAVALSR